VSKKVIQYNHRGSGVDDRFKIGVFFGRVDYLSNNRLTNTEI